ncbi:MAG: PorV/PorQ family protein [Endomicrobiia bacterium]
MKKLLIVLSLLSTVLYVGNVSGGSGTAGFTFLKMPQGVRAQAMGENFVAVADDTSSIFYNPSGMLKLNVMEISATHIIWVEQISKSELMFVYPKTVIGPIGVGINYVLVPYEKRDREDDTTYESASCWMSALHLSWARKVKNFLLGGSLKYLIENLDVQQVSGIALDVGGIYDLTSDISLGASIQNLGVQFAKQDADTLPILLRAGLAKKGLVEKRLLLASDLVYGLVDGTVSIGIGGEYLLNNYFIPRIGYKYVITNNNLDFISGLNIGFGIKYKTFGFDYSFSPKADLGVAHLISFSAKF